MLLKSLKKTLTSGYTLLFAIFVAILVLGVGTFILGVSRKEFVLSATARDSTIAFYNADSGVQCALQSGAATWSPADNVSIPGSITVTCSARSVWNGSSWTNSITTGLTQLASNDPILPTVAADLDTATYKVYAINSSATDNSDIGLRFILRDLSTTNDNINQIGCILMKIYLGIDANYKIIGVVPRTLLDVRGYNKCTYTQSDSNFAKPDPGLKTVERGIRVLE